MPLNGLPVLVAEYSDRYGYCLRTEVDRWKFEELDATIDVPPTQVAYITIVVHLVALVLVHIVELLRSPQDLAGAHCDWRTSLIEKCIDFACPCGIRDR